MHVPFITFLEHPSIMLADDIVGEGGGGTTWMQFYINGEKNPKTSELVLVSKSNALKGYVRKNDEKTNPIFSLSKCHIYHTCGVKTICT